MKTVAIHTRPASNDDTPALCGLLNSIIEIGGTTAYESPLSEKDFQSCFLSGAGFISCLVAENSDHGLLGFQALEYSQNLPADWASIATFARQTDKVNGVGTTLFKKTLKIANDQNLTAIDATIRADNTGGLRFYSKLGFEDYKVHKAVPLKDGTPVDRISKCYRLT